MTQNVLYEGKAKKIFTTEHPHEYVMFFKDDATAFNNQKKDSIEDKGRLNLAIATKIFQYLESSNIPTHFIESISEREMRVKAVRIIPVEVIVRNITAGSLCKRLGIEENMQLVPPLVEYCLKSDALGDPLMTRDHIRIMKLATEKEVEAMTEMALNINTLLQKLFADVGITLADFKLEFGLDADGNLILADEISPDGCRLWDQKTGKILDKDRFRKDLGGLASAYQEVLDRLNASA